MYYSNECRRPWLGNGLPGGAMMPVPRGGGGWGFRGPPPPPPGGAWGVHVHPRPPMLHGQRPPPGYRPWGARRPPPPRAPIPSPWVAGGYGGGWAGVGGGGGGGGYGSQFNNNEHNDGVSIGCGNLAGTSEDIADNKIDVHLDCAQSVGAVTQVHGKLQVGCGNYATRDNVINVNTAAYPQRGGKYY